jgi:MOSC domain-containing protein YiiM
LRTIGRVHALCISRRRGTIKEPVAAAQLRAASGIVGDAHAGAWHRQVSLLANESIDRLRAVMPEIGPGAFAENVVTLGVDYSDAVVGDRIELADGVVLEITQIGKRCHNECPIKQKTGDCIMPREGVFCRVLVGGDVAVGDAVRYLGGGVSTQAETADRTGAPGP